MSMGRSRCGVRSLCRAFEDCPVATRYAGYMGTVGGKWCVTTESSPPEYHEDGSPMEYTVWCYLMPKEYISILEKYN